ncbi:MAG TPA: hypothetical protein VNK25_00245 [Candidatus Nitrosotenuis sp.]|nr:hypothetical protein [Candidatus Nitrosotenuis sp.]
MSSEEDERIENFNKILSNLDEAFNNSEFGKQSKEVIEKVLISEENKWQKFHYFYNEFDWRIKDITPIIRDSDEYFLVVKTELEYLSSDELHKKTHTSFYQIHSYQETFDLKEIPTSK